jgi:hypothetical protein
MVKYTQIVIQNDSVTSDSEQNVISVSAISDSDVMYYQITNFSSCMEYFRTFNTDDFTSLFVSKLTGMQNSFWATLRGLRI